MKATNAARKDEVVTAVIPTKPATIYQFPRRNPHLRTSIAMWLDHVDQEQDKKLQWEILDWLRNLSRELRESGGSVDWRLLLFAGVSTLSMVGVLVWNQPKVQGFYAPADIFRVIAQDNDFDFVLQRVHEGVALKPAVFHFCHEQAMPLFQIGMTLDQLIYEDTGSCQALARGTPYIIERDDTLPGHWPKLAKNCVNLGVKKPVVCDGKPQF